MFWKRQKGPEVYGEEDLRRIEDHIQARFGDFGKVMHEIVSPDIHVDIAWIPPHDENDFTTLVTIGMGAHRMDIPKELRAKVPCRAEVLVTLPPDWRVDDPDERWYWPIRWLKELARMPIQQDSWLGSGHTVESRAPFAENTGLTAILLMTASGMFGEESRICALRGGEPVCFYQMVPLYREEMEFKLAQGLGALLDRFPEDFDAVVDVARPNCVKESTAQP